MADFKPSFIVKGFTMIELMVTVAIVAILVLIAIPAYQDYAIRAKITECVNEASVAKLGVSEYRQTLGAWPTSFEEAGLGGVGTSQYCTGLNEYQPSDGSFTIDVDESAIQPDLASIAPKLTPYLSLSGVINWVCTRGSTAEKDLKYLPSSCRSD